MSKLQPSPFASPDLQFETALQRECAGPVAGIDEAGRGPWAGPVVAAAVILDEASLPAGLNDSKKLSERQREKLYEELVDRASFGVGIVAPEIVDRDNILQATYRAMQLAVSDLDKPPAGLLIDGNRRPDFSCRAETLVKGDQRSLSIAAASIIAKVTRDRLMCRLAIELPQYGFERHKGYGTRAHQDALTKYGVTRHHRRSFKPIQRYLQQSGPVS